MAPSKGKKKATPAAAAKPAATGGKSSSRSSKSKKATAAGTGAAKQAKAAPTAPKAVKAKASASSSPVKSTAAAASARTAAAKGKGGGSGSGDGPHYFLMKSEPDTFSIEQLAGLPKQTSCWEGVRNYQARNIMRDEMRVGDQAFFYHSSCKVPGIVGLIEIVKEAYPDYFQFDKASEYYDASSNQESPRWLMVDVQLKETLAHMVTLEELRAEAAKPNSPLQGMLLLQRGSRLSVQPVKPPEWAHIMAMIADKKSKSNK